MAGNQPTTSRILRESRINAANGVAGTDANGDISLDVIPDSVKTVSADQAAFKEWNTSGAGAPFAAPKRVGSHYTDTTNGDLYFATATSSVSSWKKVGTGTGGGEVQWYGTQSAYDGIQTKDPAVTYNIVPA